MTAENPQSSRRFLRFLPALDRPLWRALFAFSLMANLVIAGLWIGQRFGPGREDRINRPVLAQVLPRQFLSTLPDDRRKELMSGMRMGVKQFRDLRDGAAANVLAIADALEKDTGDLSTVRTAVDGYATGAGSMAAKGSTVVMDFIAKLTPDERKLLAQSIRERAARNKDRRRVKTEAN
jgi:uncharacterized membrane protein